MKHTCTRQSTCESEYDVEYNGKIHKVRYWIIIGGTPALSFSDYSFQQRYPEIEKYKHWVKAENRYEHQRVFLGEVNPPPSLFDELGEIAVKEFLDKFVSKRELRLQRRSQLPARLVSPRFHDTEDRCYFSCELHFNYLAPVTVVGRYYAGRCEDRIIKFANDYWNRLTAFFNPIFDADPGSSNWEDLPEEKFQEALKLVTVRKT